MSQENVEIVRRLVEAWNRRDLDAAFQDLHPDAELDWSESTGVQRGIYRGAAEIRRFWEEWLDLFEEIDVRPEAFIEAGEHVVVPNRAYMRGRDGIEVHAHSTSVWTLRDGKIVRHRLYQDKEAALETVGLSVEPSLYLSICAIYRDEAPYLAEWIEFHKLVGVERFFLFNNLSRDGHRDVLAPYVEEGTVVVEDWPGDRPDFPAQAKCNFHCVEQHRHETRWLAFIDLDEFLFSPTGVPVPEVLEEFEYASAVWVSRPEFGSSGHRTKPAGLLTENYTRRGDTRSMSMKRIVNPERVVAPGVQPSVYSEGPQVNTEHEPVLKPKGPPLLSKLRLNHYFTKSEEEARAKAYRLRPSDGREHLALQKDLEGTLAMFDIVTDTTIQMYLPALRSALARREGTAATIRRS